jgi:hypothetical protein
MTTRPRKIRAIALERLVGPSDVFTPLAYPLLGFNGTSVLAMNKAAQQARSATETGQQRPPGSW